MQFIYAAILGVVEGITEFLPISSTGHMILAADILKMPGTEFWKSFEIIIQLGAIMAVVVLYWRSLFLNRKIFSRVAVAFLPTAVLGLIFYKVIKYYLLGNAVVVLWALAIGGALMILFEKTHQEKENATEDMSQISYSRCIALGLFQSLAMVPGVSRAAATIIGGLLLGLKRKTIVEFSFLLAVPTMLAAAGLDLIKSGWNYNGGEYAVLLVGFLISFAVALLAIKFLLDFIKKHTFVSFGVYRLALAVLFWLVIL